LLKNSWGMWWGERGYMRLKRYKRGEGLCGIAKAPTFAKGGFGGNVSDAAVKRTDDNLPWLYITINVEVLYLHLFIFLFFFFTFFFSDSSQHICIYMCVLTINNAFIHMIIHVKTDGDIKRS
jgi:hypothetical protein